MRRGCRVAKRIQQPEKARLIEEELNRIFSAEWLRETAEETGFVKRDREIDPALIALCVVVACSCSRVSARS